MATILLSSVGSLFGPFGQIAGTLAGSAIDHALFGPQDRHGPRLKELAVTGSSYGTPIARHYGTMRSGGSIVWAADLTEHREREGGGKGQPRTVRYSYSASFAVALSSRPIDRIGRIWAGGSLLRGKAGDMKAGGQLRVYTGHGDQPCDPLMEAALGAQCPAFRGLAYAVFEDLDLTDFGNRIPPLSFEIFAGDGSHMVELLMEDCGAGSAKGVRLDELRGFAHEAGSVRSVLQLVDRLWPLSLDTLAEGLQLRLASSSHGPAIALPPAVRWEGGEFGGWMASACRAPPGTQIRRRRCAITTRRAISSRGCNIPGRRAPVRARWSFRACLGPGTPSRSLALRMSGAKRRGSGCTGGAARSVPASLPAAS